MKVVELFAGIGGFRLAADRAGHNTVWANDNCPKACEVYCDCFGLAELCKAEIAGVYDAIPSHTLLTAGFPCQPFSSAGKKNGVRDPRGTLFQIIIDILRKRQPKFFVLENVKRLLTMEQGFHFATILSSLADLDYHIEWRLLNAMHFGLPQNRQRIFLIGIRADSHKPQPSIRLATVKDLARIRDSKLEELCYPDCWKPLEKHGKRFPTWGLAQCGKFFAADLSKFSMATNVTPLHKVLQETVNESFDFTEATLEWLDRNTPVNKLIGGVEILSNQDGGARMGYTIFGIHGVAPTLTSTTSRHYERYKVGDRYRRLTNVEYARIQGFADDHCRAVSVYDQYALYGNAVPPPMVEWVMGRITEPGINPNSLPQKSLGLFDHVEQS